MAIAIDGTPIQGTVSFGATATATNVVVGSGSNRVLVAGASWLNSTVAPTVTFNGSEGLTIGGAVANIGGFRSALWYRVGPSNATANVVFSWGGSEEAIGRVWAVNWTGASTPHGYATNTGSSGLPSVSVASVVSGEVTIDNLCHVAGNIAASQASGTQVELVNAGIPSSNRIGVSYDAGSTGTVAMNWTSDNDDWSIVAFALTEGAASETITIDKWLSREQAQRKRIVQVVPSGTIGIRG